MSKNEKNKLIIISCVLVGIGVVMSVAGYINGAYKEFKGRKGFIIGWNNDDSKNQSVKIDEQLEEFNSIDLDEDFGDIDIEGRLSGKNKINSEYGSVNLKNDLLKEECGYDVEVDFGKCEIDGNKIKGEHESYNEESNNILKVNCSCGDVQLEFNK